MTPSPWTPISLWRHTPECLAWWRLVLGADYDAARAFLKPCLGLAATSFPCPDTGLRLTIRETAGRFRAFPTGEDASDADDLDLNWDDVQAWQVDGPGLRGELARLLKLGPGPEFPDCAEIECLGTCKLCGKHRRVYLCHAICAENAIKIAENAGAAPEAGCFCFAERYPGVETVLRSRGVAMVVLAESAAFGPGGLSGSCGAVCRGVAAKVDVGSHAAEILGEKAAQKCAEMGPAAEYVFRRIGDKGDFWKIVFEGCELAPVRHLAGLTYIHALLSRPGHYFPALDLYEMENPPPPEVVAPSKRKTLDSEDRERYGTGGRPHRLLEGQTPDNLRKAKAALEAKCEDDDLSEKQRDHFEDQIAEIEKALSNSRVAAATGGATFEDAEAKQPRQAVSKTVSKAVAAMAESPTLVKHLSAAIHKGNSLFYTGGLTWDT